MKKLLGLVGILTIWACLGTVAFGQQTWYVRPDGGTRYDANKTDGQCDGKADAAYPGTGTNRHCAFNDYRWLYDDQSYGGIYAGWVISGGDTILVRGCVPEDDNNFTNQCRIGFEKSANSGGGHLWCVGGGGSGACWPPPLPAGTPSQHTRILGQNYAACNAGNAPDHSKLTYIFAGFGAYSPMNLQEAQYVDIQCLELTSHADCIHSGSPPNPRYCSNGDDDYDSDGAEEDTGTHDVYLQDLWIHGHTGRAIKGPIGGLVHTLRVEASTNGQAGWDFDDGSSTPNLPGASWQFIYSSINFSGCNQVWPETNPVSCYDHDSGGYGDGVGTPAGTCLNATIDHSTFNYNTEDGVDLGHIDTGTCAMSITNSVAIGNKGAAFKWGPNENPAYFANNLIMTNCARMHEDLPGTVSGYNTYLSIWCRAGDGISFNFRQGGVATLVNNSYAGYQMTSYDIDCWDSDCSDSVLNFQNNYSIGYDNPFMYDKGGQAGGVGGMFFQHTIGHVNRLNNFWLGMRPSSFDCSTLPVSEQCISPLLVNQPTAQGTDFTETELDSFNYNLTAGSPAIHGGVTNSLTPSTDYAGFAQTNPATVAALVYNGSLPVPAATPTFSVASGAYTPFSLTLSCTTPSPTMYYTTDGSDPTTGSTVYTGAFTVTPPETVKAICTASGYSTSAIAQANYTQPSTATPSCSPAGGTYTGTQTVTCSSVTSSSTTRCTIDGSSPNGSSPVCTNISVASSLTLKAFAQASGRTDSGVDTESYTINAPPAATTELDLGGTLIWNVSQ